MLTDKSLSDFNAEKKAAYYDKDGFMVADQDNKDKLSKPAPIEDLEKEN